MKTHNVALLAGVAAVSALAVSPAMANPMEDWTMAATEKYMNAVGSDWDVFIQSAKGTGGVTVDQTRTFMRACIPSSKPFVVITEDPDVIEKWASHLCHNMVEKVARIGAEEGEMSFDESGEVSVPALGRLGDHEVMSWSTMSRNMLLDGAAFAWTVPGSIDVAIEGTSIVDRIGREGSPFERGGAEAQETAATEGSGSKCWEGPSPSAVGPEVGDDGDYMAVDETVVAERVRGNITIPAGSRVVIADRVDGNVEVGAGAEVLLQGRIKGALEMGATSCVDARDRLGNVSMGATSTLYAHDRADVVSTGAGSALHAFDRVDDVLGNGDVLLYDEGEIKSQR